jgi:photosystem II stability/assembly factor-like uncharacterized protein
MRDPSELIDGTDAADQPRPLSKALLRQLDFLDRRGLTDEAGATPAPYAARGTAAPTPYSVGNAQKELLRAAAPPDEALRWRSIGPAGVPNGQTYGDTTTMVSGRITAIVVDPQVPTHIFVGSAGGGVWESTDTGRNWRPLTDDAPTLSIGALAAEYDAGGNLTVYAGTGEANSGYARLGQGILRSRDGGRSWDQVGQSSFAGNGFYRLVMDPRDGSRLVAATYAGAYVSEDAGETWTRLTRRRTWDASLAYHGEQRELLLATPQGLFAVGADDEELAPVPLLRFRPLDPARDRLAVAHIPADPGQAFAFAGMRGRPFLWHRSAADMPFTPVTLAAFPTINLDDALDVKQAFYDWHVSVPPIGDNVVYLGAIELVRGVRGAGGWAWSDISSRRGGTSIHPDQHAMAFDPVDPRVIYAGNDGGIFRSADAGDSWTSLNAGLAISEVEYLAQHPDDPDWMLAGLQDNGTVRRAADGTWTQVGLGDGGDCAVNQANPDVCYRMYVQLTPYRSDRRGDPDSWMPVFPPNSGPDRFSQLFYSPLEVRDDLLVVAGEVVCVSPDAGRTWIQVPLPAVGGLRSTASALGVPSSERIFVGTVPGDVFEINRGEWGGAPTLLARPRPGVVSDLHIDLASEPHRYWVTYSTVPGAVFRSTVNGAAWTDVSSNLPTTPVNAIVGDPANPDRLWVACDLGVYETVDAGGHWSLFGVGLPNALAVDLALHVRSRRLRAATRSRGIWEIDI